MNRRTFIKGIATSPLIAFLLRKKKVANTDSTLLPDCHSTSAGTTAPTIDFSTNLDKPLNKVPELKEIMVLNQELDGGYIITYHKTDSGEWKRCQ